MAWRDNLVAAGARLVPEGLRRAAWLRPRYPLVALEVREDAVVAVRLQRRKGRERLAGYGVKRLESGAFSASLVAAGVGDAAGLADAAQQVLRLAGAENAGSVSVVLPDIAARVVVVDLAELPPTRRQMMEILQFRVRKSVPFRPEEIRLAWDELGRGEDGRFQILVVVTSDQVIRPLETVLAGLGLRCGLIDLATLDVFNALRLDGRFKGVAATEDIALLNATQSYFSVMLLRGGRLIFFRAKGYHAQGGFRGAESLEAVGRELRSTIGYYDEHLLGEGIRCTHVRTAGVPMDNLLEVVGGAGYGEVRPAQLEAIVPEIRNVALDTASELLPAVGLALRRLA